MKKKNENENGDVAAYRLYEQNLYRGYGTIMTPMEQWNDTDHEWVSCLDVGGLTTKVTLRGAPLTREKAISEIEEQGGSVADLDGPGPGISRVVNGVMYRND